MTSCNFHSATIQTNHFIAFSFWRHFPVQLFRTIFVHKGRIDTLQLENEEKEEEKL